MYKGMNHVRIQVTIWGLGLRIDNEQYRSNVYVRELNDKPEKRYTYTRGN